MRDRLRRTAHALSRLRSPKRAVAAALLVIVAATVVVAIARDRGNKNLYVLQAEAFLRGTLEVPDENLLDAAYYRGHVYVPLPPFPAVVLTPFVAIFGRRLPSTVVGVLLALFSIVLLNRVLRTAGIADKDRWWVAAGFFLGTGYWWCLLKTWEMWCFAHVVATAMMLLSIHEAYLGRRATTAGLAWGAAAMSRQLCIWAAPFLIVALWQASPDGRGMGRALRFLIAGGLLFIPYLAMNWARFGSPFDTGYSYIHHVGFLADRARAHGLFNLVYLPFNFVFMFLQGFHVIFDGPLKLAPHDMDKFGTSLTMASPFLATAFFARGEGGLTRAAWLSVLLMLGSSLLYYNNGWVQMNCQRFSLDFMPILIWLQARGAKAVSASVWRAGVVWAVGLNVLAIIGIRIAYAFFSRLGYS